jgi:hypothetical protein
MRSAQLLAVALQLSMAMARPGRQPALPGCRLSPAAAIRRTALVAAGDPGLGFTIF